MVPHTNCKNIELDLLKRYTTLQSIRYLADRGFDPRYLQPNINFIKEKCVSHPRKMFKSSPPL